MANQSAWIRVFRLPLPTWARLVTVLAAVVLMATAAPDAMPGDAAILVAQHAGIDDLAPLSHQAWGWIGSVFDTIPLGSLSHRWNLLSALCGAACCGLTVLLAARLPRVNPRWDLMVAHPRATANLAGVAAGLLLLGCLPLRIASAIALPATAELLALLYAAWLLIRFAETRSLRFAYASLAVLSIIMTQSATAILAGPAFVLFLLHLLTRQPIIPPKHLAALAAALVTPGLVVVTIGAGWFLAQPSAEWAGLTSWGSVVIQMVRELYIELRHGLPGIAIVLVALFSLMPFAIVLFLTGGRTEGKPLLAALMIALGVVQFLNLPFTPFAMFGLRPLLLTPYALSAMWLGYLAAYLIGSAQSPIQINYWLRRNPHLARRVADGGAALLAILMAVTATKSQLDLQIAPSMIVARHADLIASQLRDGVWLVTSSELDPLVRIKAHEQGVRPVILSAHRFGHRPYQRMLADRLGDPRLASMVEAGLLPLLRERLNPSHAPAPDLATIGDPGLLRFVAETAWPDRTLYWNREPDGLTTEAYMENQRAFWGALDSVETGDDTPEQALRLRRISARIANDAGVWMQDRGADQPAAEAYREATRIDPENLSARLNLRALLADDDPTAPALEAEIETLSARLRDRVQLSTIVDLYGTIHHEAAMRQLEQRWDPADPATHLDPRITDMLAITDDPTAAQEAKRIANADPAVLLNIARLAAGSNRPRLARTILETMPDIGPLAKAVRIEQAQIAMQLGEPETARRILLALSETEINDPRALILLALLTVESDPLACDRYLQQLETFPDRLPALSAPIARVYEIRGNRPAAAFHMSYLAKIQPLNKTAHQTLIRLNLEQGLVTEAFQAAQPLLALDSRDAWANTALTLYLSEKGETAGAEAARAIAEAGGLEVEKFLKID